MGVASSEKLQLTSATLEVETSLLRAMREKSISYELLEQLMGAAMQMSVATREDQLTFCRCFLMILLSRRPGENFYGNEGLVALYFKLLQVPCPKGGQLFALYRAFISFLAEENASEISLPFLEEGVLVNDYIPHPFHSVEGAILAIILGTLQGKEALVQQGVQISLFTPVQTLFIKEEEYKPEVFDLAKNLLAFLVARVVDESPSMKESELSEEKESPLGAYFLFLKECIVPKLSFRKLLFTQEFLKKKEQQTLGYAKLRSEAATLYCSLCGCNTGFASLHKKEIEIVSIGPHLAPLAEMELYGVNRMAALGHSCFKDLVVEEGRFQGWSRVVSQGKGLGSSWIFIDIESQKKKGFRLKTRWIDKVNAPEMFLAFFVKASKVVIDHKYHLQPATLDRYQGTSATVCFYEKQETLVLQALVETSMQVIPLAGDHHFWGAKFLLAYAMEPQIEYIFDIL